MTISKSKSFWSMEFDRSKGSAEIDKGTLEFEFLAGATIAQEKLSCDKLGEAVISVGEDEVVFSDDIYKHANSIAFKNNPLVGTGTISNILTALVLEASVRHVNRALSIEALSIGFTVNETDYLFLSGLSSIIEFNATFQNSMSEMELRVIAEKLGLILPIFNIAKAVECNGDIEAIF